MGRALVCLIVGAAISAAFISSAEDEPEQDQRAAVCAAVEALDESLDALEDSESIEEYRARKDVVRQDFDKLRTVSGGKYEAECDAFESSLAEFEQSLASLGDGGLISGVLGLAADAAKLAAAGDRLDDAIDCP